MNILSIKPLPKRCIKKLLDAGFTKTLLINADGKEMDLESRSREANQKKADLFISIHHDSVKERYLKYWRYNNQEHHYSDLFQGYSIWVYHENPADLLIAKLLGKHLSDNGFKRTLHHAEIIKDDQGNVLDMENYELLDEALGIYKNDLRVLKTSEVPAILLECGVIVNRDEEVLLSSPDYQEKLVSAIAVSIQAFYEKLPDIR